MGFLCAEWCCLQIETAVSLPSDTYSFFLVFAALARTSSGMLNQRGEIRHLCLVAEVKKSVPCFITKQLGNCVFIGAVY